MVHLYEEACRMVKEFMVTMMQGRQSENHLNSIL